MLRECGRPIASDAFSAEAMRLIAAIDTTVAEHGAVAIAVSDLSFHCLSGAVDECAASTDSTIRAITDTTRVTATRMHDTLLRAKER